MATSPDYVPAVIPEAEVPTALYPVVVPVSPVVEPEQTIQVVPVEPEHTMVAADFSKYERKVKNYFLGIWRVVTATFFLISMGMFIIGCLYIRQCSGSKFIPVYLITSGVLGAIQFVVMVTECCLKKPKDGILTGKNIRLYEGANFLLAMFLGWTFFGSIPILMTSVQTGDPEAELYCHKVPYTVSFYSGVVLDILYVLLFFVGFMILCFCGIMKPDSYSDRKYF